MKRIPTVVPTLFFALFLVIGLAMLGFAGRAWWKSTQVEQWPSVEGEWLQRSLAENSDSDGSTWQAGHQAIYDKLMSGDHVRVRYNPRNPAEAALAHGLNKSTVMLAVFGLVWTGFTLGLMVLVGLTGSADTALIDRLIVR